MTTWFRNLFLLAITIMSLSCAQQTQTQKDLKGINRVISGIESRQEMESRVIENEKKAISLLKQNFEKVNSDGMREKITREITLKESVMEKSLKNKSNQEVILNQLYAKRDSIMELGNLSE